VSYQNPFFIFRSEPFSSMGPNRYEPLIMSSQNLNGV